MTEAEALEDARDREATRARRLRIDAAFARRRKPLDPAIVAWLEALEAAAETLP